MGSTTRSCVDCKFIDVKLEVMRRAVVEAMHSLRTYIEGNKGRVAKFLAGQGDPGTRAFPSPSGNNDAIIGVRIDNGEKIIKDGVEYKRYKLQVNKNAANPTLKSLAAKDSHQVLANGDVRADGKGDVGEFFDQLEANLEDNLMSK